MAGLRLTRLRVSFPRPTLSDVDSAVRAELEKSRGTFPARGEIALAVGSRGVANIDRVVKTTAATLRSWGLEPFVVPAMGSHGGATAAGQAQLLSDYGISEDRIGCPVRSSMDVASLEAGDLPFPLFMDRHAFDSAGVVVINRIKPHTDFHGSYESGLAKMAVIGLGKERQASAMHRFGVPGLRDGIPRAAERILRTGKIIGGLGLVENAYDETMAIEFVAGSALLAREPDLLEVARSNMPKLPVDALDILIVDELGKNISGTGMDTNVIGRTRIAGEPEPAAPQIRMIVATDLTAPSHGNATGVGLADVVTRQLYDKIDVGVMYTNVFTSGFPERGKIPVVAPTARDAYACALRACGPIQDGAARIVRIKNTLQLGEIYVSDAVLRDLVDRTDIAVMTASESVFDERGEMTSFGNQR
jgi:hypothetical protein